MADRDNRRLVVFDLEGRYRRVVGAGELTSPSGLAVEESFSSSRSCTAVVRSI